jgi:glycine/D-amino acid oxidase-like deaminating enzyme
MDHDPHRLNYTEADQQYQQDCIAWHRKKARELRDLIFDTGPDPLRQALLDHHDHHIDALLVLLPAPKPQKPPAQAKPTRDLAGEARRLAHRDGITIQQATAILSTTQGSKTP